MGGPRLLLAITVAIAVMSAAIMVVTGDAHVLIRATARTSLVMFALAYVARPATQLWPGAVTKRLLAERKWIGDGFAISHLAHLAAIIVVATQEWEPFIASRDAGALVGAVAYVLLFAMAITSIDSIRKAMSRGAWNALHRTGMHLLWVVFAASYAKRITSPTYVLPIVVLVAIALVRAAAWVRARGKARARASLAA